mgnify:CR=1 FL=1
MHNILKNKKILLGVTGSIAAFKSPLIVRELTKMGAEVKVVMTPSACQFVTPITLSSVSKNQVVIEMFDLSSQKEGAWHIHLAHWCDLAIIAPCSATTLGKLANGIADNALVAVFMAIPQNIPILLAPAMDTTMFEFPSTQKNIQTLQEWGLGIIPPDTGELASGLCGLGRLAEIPKIIEEIASKFTNLTNERPEILDKSLEPIEDSIYKDKFQAELDLIQLKQNIREKQLYDYYHNKKIIVTAGPTIERIDPVRYITNSSSGKMGYAIAEELAKYSKNVTLVSGPVNLPKPDNIKTIYVESADDMHNAVKDIFASCDILIMAAAIADFAPKHRHEKKIKNSSELAQLELIPNVDILKKLGDAKAQNQILVGFALETHDEIENAKKKIIEKNLDWIILNKLSDSNQIFGNDENEIIMIDKTFEIAKFEKSKKTDLAKRIVETIAKISTKF